MHEDDSDSYFSLDSSVRSVHMYVIYLHYVQTRYDYIVIVIRQMVTLSVKRLIQAEHFLFKKEIRYRSAALTRDRYRLIL